VSAPADLLPASGVVNCYLRHADRWTQAEAELARPPARVAVRLETGERLLLSRQSFARRLIQKVPAALE
jgi:hypothetical protein